MNNNTDHIISNENDIVSFTFTEWPLDEDDEEFRAGYPFSPVPSEELNEQETWNDPSPTSDDDFPLHNSSNNGFSETIEANDQSNCFFCDVQEEILKFDVKSSTIHDDNNGYNANADQKQDYEEHEPNEHGDQYSIRQTDNVIDTQTDQAHPPK